MRLSNTRPGVALGVTQLGAAFQITSAVTQRSKINRSLQGLLISTRFQKPTGAGDLGTQPWLLLLYVAVQGIIYGTKQRFAFTTSEEENFP
jgi:hypothetical protein